MTIVKSDNCGNSPKNAFIEEFIDALLRGKDAEPYVVNDLPIQVAGQGTLRGIGALSMDKIAGGSLSRAFIFDAISHGKKGAIDLRLVTKDEITVDVGVFLEFKSLKADKIASLKIISARDGGIHG